MATELYGYLIVDNDMAINTLPYETEDYKLLPGSIAFVIGGGAYILTPSNVWVYLNPELQKLILPVFDGKASSGGGGGGGGGGDCNLFPVTITVDYDNPKGVSTYPFTTDKTFAEIAEAIDAGKMLLIREDSGTFLEMNVPSGVYHEPGLDSITFNYARFSVQDSSTWNATLWAFTLVEDGEHYLVQTEASLSVT